MKKLISIFLVSVLLLSGCTKPKQQTDKLNVITTYYPYQLAASEIGSDNIDVSSIYPADSDAHSYELSPKQTIQLQDADLVIITNQQEDSKIYNSLQNNDNLLILEPETNGNEDLLHSHAWLSPAQMLDSVESIAETLVDLDVSNKVTYQNNASNLEAKLNAINDQYTNFAASQTKPIVATHDAYTSLTSDYNIEFHTLYGQHHDDEPTTKEVINTVDLINDNNISTIFVEQDDTSNKVMHQIADEAAITCETIFTLETESSLQKFNSITDFYEYNLEMMELSQK